MDTHAGDTAFVRLPFIACAFLGFACGNAIQTVDAGPPFVPTHTRALGLNDLTFLFPLENLDAGTRFPDAATLLPFASVTRLTSASPRVDVNLQRLRVVAVRFDLCDRALPGPCPRSADGVLRVVLQPVLSNPPSVEDIALHAFFPVPAGDLPRFVDGLRGLAEVQGLPRTAPLQVVPPRPELAALINPYLSADRLLRLTLFGQESERSAVVWVFRGEELQGGRLRPIVIPGIDAGTQEVLLFSGDSFSLVPVADAPPGFERATMASSFRAATAAEQLESVRALLAVDNPLRHTSNTVQCASCHLTTTVTPARAADAGIAVTSLPERYDTGEVDPTPLGPPETRRRTMRNLGYFESVPLVSQRVVNETAHTLEEVEARFPP